MLLLNRNTWIFSFTVFFTLGFLAPSAAHGMCAQQLSESSDEERSDLREIAQWLLFDSQMAESHLYLYRRIQLEKNSWSLTDEELPQLAALVPLLDVQYLLYQGLGKRLPFTLVAKARSVLDQVFTLSQSGSEIWQIRKTLVTPLDWNPNDNWNGSRIDVGQDTHGILGALWILATRGNSLEDLDRVKRIVDLYEEAKRTKGSFYLPYSIDTKEQHAAVMAQRRIALRVGKELLPSDASVLIQKFLLPSFHALAKDSDQVSQNFIGEIRQYSPFRQADRFSENGFDGYIQMLERLADPSFYFSRMRALGVIYTGPSLAHSFARTTVGWMQSDDYWDLFELARSHKSTLAEAVIATHLAIRHLYGENIVAQEHFPELLGASRTRIQKYLRSKNLEGDLLEEPILIAAFGKETDQGLLYKYLQQSGSSFQIELMEDVWKNVLPRHLEGSITGLMGQYQRIQQGLRRSIPQVLMGAMEARFES